MAPSPMKPHDASRETDCEKARAENLKLRALKVPRCRARLHFDRPMFANRECFGVGP